MDEPDFVEKRIPVDELRRTTGRDALTDPRCYNGFELFERVRHQESTAIAIVVGEFTHPPSFPLTGQLQLPLTQRRRLRLLLLEPAAVLRVVDGFRDRERHLPGTVFSFCVLGSNPDSLAYLVLELGGPQEPRPVREELLGELALDAAPEPLEHSVLELLQRVGDDQGEALAANRSPSRLGRVAFFVLGVHARRSAVAHPEHQLPVRYAAIAVEDAACDR